MEWKDRSAVNFAQFYRHRARRLLPPLLLVLLTTSAAAVVAAPGSVAELRPDLLAAAGYYANWRSIFTHRSYFEFIGRPPLLLHLWSLAVEEQFYLCWPPLLVAVLLICRRRRVAAGRQAVVVLAVAGSLASAGLMAVLSIRSGYPVPNDPSRVYYGTDTHTSGLLLGAALAAVWPLGRLPKLSRRKRRLLDGAGLSALTALVGAYTQVDEFSPALYRGGFLLFSVAAGIAVAATCHPQCYLGRLLSGQPLRWIGERSYGLYLWHWPVFELTRTGLDLQLSSTADLTLRLTITAALTELSWRLVETPIRRGALHRRRVGWRSLDGRPLDPALRARLEHSSTVERRRRMTFVITGGTALVLVGAGLTSIHPSASAAQVLDQPYPNRPLSAPLRTQPPRRVQHARAPAVRSRPPRGPVVAYGDSVMLGASAALAQALPGIRVNAVVGRQPTALMGCLRQLRTTGQLAPVVVVHSGDNGVFAAQTFDTALNELTDRARVVVVNIRVPRRWQDPVNTLLAEAVHSHPNAVLADWHATSSNHPEYFVSDGVHLTVTGEDAFARLIARTVQS